jgi:hypothetical protein
MSAVLQTSPIKVTGASKRNAAPMTNVDTWKTIGNFVNTCGQNYSAMNSKVDRFYSPSAIRKGRDSPDKMYHVSIFCDAKNSAALPVGPACRRTT